ncbi:MAG TPA: hypothetical protein VKT49_12560, partial [Bryobacteraceae bacterium]|nr:hypothetical protein [Bryobacteraceae bacterium]
KSATTLALAILTTAASAPLAAQWLDHPTPGLPRTANGKPNLAAPAPRTADGHPDLSGLWNKISPKYKSNIVADLKPSEIQPWAQKLVEERAENLQKDYMHDLCLPLGPGYATGADSTGAEMIKIVQTPSLIIILNPDLTYRQIFMDGRQLEKSPNPDWMGYSVGRWEGNTLVVESNGFNDKSWLDHDGHPHTEALHMTERYTRRNLGNLDVEITLSDPGAYAHPWTIKVRAELAPDTEMIEFVCNEANKREHWVGKASDETKNAVKVDPAILATYAGKYLEQPRYWSPTGVPRVVTITVSGGTLYGDMDGRGATSLLAKSETEFSGLYGLGVEFNRDGSLFVKHVSGNYRFTRQK